MSLLPLICILIPFIPFAFSCLANGVCGPSLGGIGSCHPPIQQHQAICQPACNPGYQCGPYGCTQLRSPDQLFMECCERRGLPKACLQKCSIHNYTKDAIISMYFKRDACSVSAAAEIQFCAAQGRDHRQCCARNGVGTTLAGDKCLVFCDQRPGNVTQLDYSYLICYDRFENMKSCFWHDLMSRNSLKPFLRHF
ncbi:DB module [Dirofilaria immitis]|nr:DB module [Dirofilaria immitis]